MPWIDADEWLAICEMTRGPLLRWADRPLNFEAAAQLALITGPYLFEYQSDGTTRILVEEVKDEYPTR